MRSSWPEDGKFSLLEYVHHTWSARCYKAEDIISMNAVRDCSIIPKKHKLAGDSL